MSSSHQENVDVKCASTHSGLAEPTGARSGLVVLASVFGLAAAGVRLAIACSDPLWLDELHTAWVTGGGLNQVASRAAAGNQTPLFFWLVWFVRTICDWFQIQDPRFGLRLISLLSGCGLCTLATWVVFQWTRSWLATLCVAGWVTVEPSLVMYATEARPYALMQLLGLIQVMWFWKWLGRFCGAGLSTIESARPPVFCWSDLGAVVITSMMLAVHVTSLWLPLVELCFVLGLTGRHCFQTQHRCYMTRAWISVAILTGWVALMVAPVLLDLGRVVQQRENWELISDRKRLTEELSPVLRWGILMPLVGIGLVMLREKTWRPRELSGPSSRQRAALRQPLWLVGAWATLPWLGLWLLDFTGTAPVAISRYGQIATIAIPIFGSLAVGWMRGTWQRLGLTTCVLSGCLVVNPWLMHAATSGTPPQLRWEDWSSVINEINRLNQETERPVLLFSNLIEDRQALDDRRHSFQDYLRFPLKAVPVLQLQSDQILVYPTLSFTQLQASDVQRLKERQGAWVIIRAHKPMIGELASRLVTQLNQGAELDKHAVWRVEVAHFEQSPWSDVKLLLLWTD